MKYNIHLNVYDGPLDLLCDLISRQKIDIKDISISEITSQYLAYIDMLNEMDLEVASEFIIMASKLLEIKSRYLLYKQHHEEHVGLLGGNHHKSRRVSCRGSFFRSGTYGKNSAKTTK